MGRESETELEEDDEREQDERKRWHHELQIRTFSIASSAACPSRTIPKMIESPLSNAGCGPSVISN